VTTFDYVFPLLLILSVVRQLRGKHLTVWSLLWPIGLVAWAAFKYVRGFPLRAADVLLVASCAAIGIVLGMFAGRHTEIYRKDDQLIARATMLTLLYWTVGTIGRLLFGLYAEHGGGPTIARFSSAHGLVFAAWTSALTLMALAEVAGRTVMLAPRAWTIRQGPRAPSLGQEDS
jgi:hypothetical protein